MERKKLKRKRSQVPQKGIWTAVKDNAALIAAIIALFGVLITGAINTYIANKDQAAQRELEIMNAQRQRELEQDKAQETALQIYLTEVGDMILDDSSPLRDAKAGGEASKLARAKTLTVLLGLNGGRKRILLQFLKEEQLIYTPGPKVLGLPGPIVDLSGADLSYAKLSGVDKDRNVFYLNNTHLVAVNLYRADMKYSVLDEANLSLSDLTRANLIESSLSDTNLRGTDLTRAHLDRCDLAGANLLEASLRSATLSDAYLGSANLRNADLGGANLEGALLSDADLKGANLEGANLEGATMPNGQKYEDWLKSKD